MPPLPDDDGNQPVPTTIERRDLMKLGAGVVAAALMGQGASAQEGGVAAKIAVPPPGSPPPMGQWMPHTGPGYKNDANRLGGNGPMDDTTRKIVKYVRSTRNRT